jgi:flagellin-like hook-associated protein FlgL
MRINTNVGAINASRNIFVNNMAVENSMRKLSSGLKISRAADDAAGLSIANKLRTQSRSLTQAASNAEQGNAMLQIAEGAAQTIQRIIERQKELITQRDSTGNNSTVSGTLGTEIATLQTESARILADADFQGASVFASLTFPGLRSDVERTGDGECRADADLADRDVDAGQRRHGPRRSEQRAGQHRCRSERARLHGAELEVRGRQRPRGRVHHP